MPTFLSDPPLLLYGVAALILIVPLIASFLLPAPAKPEKDKGKKKNVWYIAAVVGGVLLIGLLLLDRFFESDREQMIRKLEEMSAGIRENNLDKVFNHISGSFRKGTFDKQSLRSRADEARRSGQVNEIRIWDETIESIDPDAKKATVRFSFSVRGSVSTTNVPYLCKAFFAKEADGQWRLQGFDIFNPVVDQNSPMPIPGLQ